MAEWGQWRNLQFPTFLQILILWRLLTNTSYMRLGCYVESRNRFRSTTPMSYERNAMIELCMIHLRNLIDFFTPPPSSLKPQGDDVIASHYVPDWENHRPNISPSLEATRKRIH